MHLSFSLPPLLSIPPSSLKSVSLELSGGWGGGVREKGWEELIRRRVGGGGGLETG